jgi:hypothetical protein
MLVVYVLTHLFYFILEQLLLLSFFIHTYLHTYHSRLIPERVVESSLIFLQDAHGLPKRHGYEGYWLQSISGGDDVNPFVVFYDIHGRKRFSLWLIHKEGLCPSSGDNNRLMMMEERGRCYSFVLSRTPQDAKFINSQPKQKMELPVRWSVIFLLNFFLNFIWCHDD